MDAEVMENQVCVGKLMQDLRVLAADAEALLRATAEQTDERVSAARGRMQNSLAVARESLASAQETVVVKTRQAAKVTDEYVHNNPWVAMGITAGFGVVVGMLISRGR